MITLLVRPDPEAAAQAAARLLSDVIADERDADGLVHLALAGGSSPRRVYELLAETPRDWRGVHLWLGDERRVDPDDPEANAHLVRDTLMRAGGLAPDQLHAVDWSRGDAAAVAAYVRDIEALVRAGDSGRPELDVAFLGLGEDGHTASLFPGGPELAETGTCALVTGAPKPPPVRLTLTLPVLAAARRRVLLVTGDGKAAAVAAMLAGPDPSTPASLLPRHDTTLVLDTAAASRLDPEAGDA